MKIERYQYDESGNLEIEVLEKRGSHLSFRWLAKSFGRIFIGTERSLRGLEPKPAIANGPRYQISCSEAVTLKLPMIRDYRRVLPAIPDTHTTRVVHEKLVCELAAVGWKITDTSRLYVHGEWWMRDIGRFLESDHPL